jgi:hypothetical protein
VLFWRLIALVCVLGSAGAGAIQAVSDPDECPGVCARPIDYTIDPGFTPDERALVEQAMHAWQRGTGGRVCFEPGGRDLVVERIDRAEQLQPRDPDWAKHVALTEKGHIWLVEPRVPDPGVFRALMIHEIGHHLGLGHVEDTPLTYMHSSIDDTPEELREHGRLPPRDARDYCAAHRCTCAL